MHALRNLMGLARSSLLGIMPRATVSQVDQRPRQSSRVGTGWVAYWDGWSWKGLARLVSMWMSVGVEVRIFFLYFRFK